MSHLGLSHSPAALPWPNEKDKAEADKGDAEDDKDKADAEDKDKGDAEDDKGEAERGRGLTPRLRGIKLSLSERVSRACGQRPKRSSMDGHVRACAKGRR